MKYLGFIGSLLIVIALTIIILYMYNVIPSYLTIAIFFPSLLAGLILTFASLMWLNYIYSMKGTLKYFFISILLFVLTIVFFILGLGFANYSIDKLFYFLSFISFVLSVLFGFLYFRKVYQATYIYTFYLTGKFILWSLFSPLILYFIFWFITSTFYKIDFIDPELVKYFEDFKFITALFFSWLTFYSMIIVSFVFLTIAFLNVNAEKEEEKIKEELEELE